MSSLRFRNLKIIECPRDAWQGVKTLIPTGIKATYIQALINAGFDTIDVGSFVSPKAVPQVSDTADLLERIKLENNHSKLLVIVANLIGAEIACSQPKVTYVGYPFSLSETFQQKNTNTTISQSFNNIKLICKLCIDRGKQPVIYLSMGFGNPYGDPWSPELVADQVDRLASLGITTFSLADTVGLSRPSDIAILFGSLSETYPDLTFGAHFHSRPDAWLEKVTAAYENGCRRFDGTLSGFGGCPFALDELVGNVATENLIDFADREGLDTGIDPEALRIAREILNKTITPYY